MIAFMKIYEIPADKYLPRICKPDNQIKPGQLWNIIPSSIQGLF